MHKILVIDDDIDLLDMLKLFFKRNNFNVHAISNWQNIDESIRTFQPHLILLDISLRGADGRVICKQLKTHKETAHIPVLLFSANYGVRQTIPDFFADGFMEKPFDPVALIGKINSILSNKDKVSF